MSFILFLVVFMQKFFFSFLLLAFLSLTASAYAQGKANTRADEELNGGTVGADIVYADNETKDAVHHKNANMRHKIPARYALEDYLPILGKKARDNGVPAGFPFFVTLLYYHMEIPQIITDAKGWGQDIYLLDESQALGAEMFNAETRTNSAGFRAGFKLLPFLDIFGVFVYTKVNYGFEAKFNDAGTAISGTINPDYVMKNTIDVNAFTGGVGLSLAYGGRLGKSPVVLFGVANANFAWTKTDRTDNTISTVIAGARIGAAFILPKNMRLSISVGYQYQQMIGWNAGSVRGRYIANLPDEAFIDPNAGFAPAMKNRDLTVEYSAKSSNASNHAMNAGIVFSPCAYADVILEFAFLSRFSTMVATNFKF